MSQPFLQVERLARRFPAPGGETVTVFDEVSFNIRQGEFICVIGHSGCGKSTILNILAGLDTPSEGSVLVNNREVVGPGLERGVVFQNYSLLPWLSALRNVAFAVRARYPDWSRNRILEYSREQLALVGIDHGAELRKPHELSGGMRQRVSIARAFATRPEMLLMDEPFGALDALTRGTIQEELLRIWHGSGQTVFMITHDVDEAMLLADRILLMTNGPHARVGESVAIDLPRPRERTEIIHHPAYYPTRNHLVEFLVHRSQALAGDDSLRGGPRIVHPACEAA